MKVRKEKHLTHNANGSDFQDKAQHRNFYNVKMFSHLENNERQHFNK